MSISIKDPCHEDWSKMTSTERGAFCKLCAKEVVDFTDKSPFEIKEILFQELSKGAGTCGRINNYQLDQLNDEFFQWRSDKEMFRAVWMFSLLAVFGLTLFSCQNTLSRELIDQLNVESTAVLNSDSTQVDLEIPNDSLTANVEDSLKIPPFIWNPEIVTYQGIMPLENWVRVDIWDICTPTLGLVTITGSIVSTEPAIEFLKGFQVPLFEIKPESKPLQPVSSPRNNPSSNNQGLKGLLAGGEKAFDSFIFPNPINEESRLYVMAKYPVDLEFEIYSFDISEIVRKGSHFFEVGKHKIDLRFSSLNSGAYQLHLFGNGQTSILDFTV